MNYEELAIYKMRVIGRYSRILVYNKEFLMTYDELLSEAFDAGLVVKEKPLKANKGRIIGNNIAIKKEIPTLKEKSCVLAEELGHYYTSVGNIINQKIAVNRKQEYKARLWAYNRQVGLMGIVKTYEAGCQSLYEMAEYLDVTEEFLIDALQCYRGKYGERTIINNYIISFEPYLSVIKMI